MTKRQSTAPQRASRLPELWGWLFAAALSVITVSLLIGGERGDVLFRDGDALFPVLVAHSLGVGQPQDWALSSVLFIPELLVFLPLSWLGLSNTLTLALAGAVWFTALYGAVRLVAPRRERGATPVLASVLAHALFCIVALSESSLSRDSLDLASLLASSTYYAATVVACLATVGLVRRRIAGGGRSLLFWLGGISALSMFTNPLYAVWGILPILIIGFVVFRRAMLVPALVLVVPGLVGFGARWLLGDTIVQSGLGYIQPVKAFSSLAATMTALGDRLNEAGGIVIVALTAGVIIIALLVAARASSPERRFVAAMAGCAPLIVLLAVVAMGGQAERYLQPFAFFPILLLTLVTVSRVAVPAASAVGAVLTGAAVVAAGLSTAAAVRTEQTRVDADLACVVSYVNAAETTGAGQYWAVRLPKSVIDDPRDLVQVDYRLAPYDWLVNRDDATGAEIGYLITDSQAGDAAFAPDDDAVLTGATELSCGRYTIIELAQPVPLAR